MLGSKKNWEGALSMSINRRKKSQSDVVPDFDPKKKPFEYPNTVAADARGLWFNHRTGYYESSDGRCFNKEGKPVKKQESTNP